jgi:hypothetical protein
MIHSGSIKKVFFLGAGFSKAINSNYLLLPELSMKIKISIIERNRDLFNRYKHICGEIGENIEELLTYLSSDLPWKTEYVKALDKVLYIYITKKISTIISQIDASVDKDTLHKPQSLFTDFINKNQSLCLTLNYDTLLEKIVFSGLGEEYQKINGYEGFYNVPIQSVSDRWKIQTSAKWGSNHEDPKGKKLPAILKLHGSINWMWAGASPSDPIYCSGKDTNITKFNFVRSTLDLQHFIVPPTLDKSSFYTNNILKSIWILAFILLSLSEEIYIIGFSLPDSDISIKYFFKEVVNENKKKDINKKLTIYVINTDISNELKKRYKNVFPEKNLNFDYCCEHTFDRFVKEKLSVNQ